MNWNVMAGQTNALVQIDSYFRCAFENIYKDLEFFAKSMPQARQKVLCPSHFLWQILMHNGKS